MRVDSGKYEAIAAGLTARPVLPTGSTSRETRRRSEEPSARPHCRRGTARRGRRRSSACRSGNRSGKREGAVFRVWRGRVRCHGDDLPGPFEGLGIDGLVGPGFDADDDGAVARGGVWRRTCSISAWAIEVSCMSVLRPPRLFRRPAPRGRPRRWPGGRAGQADIGEDGEGFGGGGFVEMLDGEAGVYENPVAQRTSGVNNVEISTRLPWRSTVAAVPSSSTILAGTARHMGILLSRPAPWRRRQPGDYPGCSAGRVCRARGTTARRLILGWRAGVVRLSRAAGYPADQVCRTFM